MRKFAQIATSIIFVVSSLQCGYFKSDEEQIFSGNPDVPEEFANYWYTEKTEINEYAVHQTINGINKKARLSMTYTVEPFSKSKHVIIKDPNAKLNDKIIVLHNNNLFESGTSTIMNSIFTPINLNQLPHTTSAFSSTQNIKYQHFTRLDKDDDTYHISHASFAEHSNDDTYQIATTLLEDALFNQIRINPKNIPTGTVDLIKSFNTYTKNQTAIKPAAARIQFQKSESTSTCKIEYMHSERTIIINFEEELPHKITSWSIYDTNNYSFEATLKKTNKILIEGDEIKS